MSGLFSILADFNLLAGSAAGIVAVVILSFLLATKLRPRHGLVWHELLPQRPAPGRGKAANLYLIENVGLADAEEITILFDVPPTDVVLTPATASGRADVDGRPRIVTIERLAAGGKLGVRVATKSVTPPSLLTVSWRRGASARAEPPWWRRLVGKSL